MPGGRDRPGAVTGQTGGRVCMSASATTEIAEGTGPSPARSGRTGRFWRMAGATAVALAAILSVSIWRLRSLEGIPDVGDPFDVAAALQPIPIPDDENAYLLYAEARGQFTRPPCVAVQGQLRGPELVEVRPGDPGLPGTEPRGDGDLAAGVRAARRPLSSAGRAADRYAPADRPGHADARATGRPGGHAARGAGRDGSGLGLVPCHAAVQSDGGPSRAADRAGGRIGVAQRGGPADHRLGRRSPGGCPPAPPGAGGHAPGRCPDSAPLGGPEARVPHVPARHARAARA